MLGHRPLTTGEALGLLAAVLVVLLILPLRSPASAAALVVAFAVSVTTLGGAIALLAYRDDALDVTDGLVAVAAGVVLVVPSATMLVALPALSTTDLSLVFVAELVPDTLSLVVRWALPAALLFPLSLARTIRGRAAVVVVLLGALLLTLGVVQPTTVSGLVSGVVQFVGATCLGGPLFVAGRTLPRGDAGPAVDTT